MCLVKGQLYTSSCYSCILSQKQIFSARNASISSYSATLQLLHKEISFGSTVVH